MAVQVTQKAIWIQGDKRVSNTDLDLPDIGDPTLQAEVDLSLFYLKSVLGTGFALFVVWIIAMLILL
jgi:hypothetical protein